MKYISIIFISILFYSCSNINKNASFVTEAYIKTKLEEHIKEDVSTISIKNKYKFYSIDELERIEINFVDYKEKNYFVLTCHEVENEKSNILILNKDECKNLITKLVEIIYNAKSTKPVKNNIDYFDYTVKDGIFFSATNNIDDTYQKIKDGQVYLFVWFDTYKFRLNQYAFLKILEEFNSISI